MATEFTRTLNFRTTDLGENCTFVVTFDDEKNPGIYKSYFPTAFKCVYFSPF
jgi:hypothetical protein